MPVNLLMPIDAYSLHTLGHENEQYLDKPRVLLAADVA